MNTSDIAEYCAKNTDIEIQDVFKYLYQKCFGCEHLAAEYSYALDRIRQEMTEADRDDLPEVELLGERFCRVHLKALKGDLEALAEKLTGLFIKSAQRQPDGLLRLENELEEFVRLAGSGEVPFDAEEVTGKIAKWRALGFPAVHHSDRFREAHHPAYRVIMREYLRELAECPGIDGITEC